MNTDANSRAEEARRRLAASLGASAPLPAPPPPPEAPKPQPKQEVAPRAQPALPASVVPIQTKQERALQRHAERIIAAIKLKEGQRSAVLQTLDAAFPLNYLINKMIVGLNDRTTRSNTIKSVLELYKIQLMGTQILEAKGGAADTGPRMMRLTSGEADLPTIPGGLGTEGPAGSQAG